MKSFLKSAILFFFICTFAACEADKEQAKIIGSEQDLVGASVVLMTGSTQEMYASQHYTKSKLMRMETLTDILAAMSNDMADATLMSHPVWEKIGPSFPNLVVVVSDLDKKPIGVAFNKNESVLLMQFNDFLKELKESGKCDEILKGWKEDASKRKMPVVDDCPNGVLTIATSPEMEPYGFVQDGVPVGAELEVLTLFAQSLGMKPEFMCMNFSAIIPCVLSGKAVMGCGVMCITEERAKSVNFSEPWLEEATDLVVTMQHAPDSIKTALVAASDKQSWREELTESFENNILAEDRYKLLGKGLRTTIYISLMAALFGTLFGILLCYLSLRKSKHVRRTTYCFVEFMRCMPQVVFLMIMFYLVFGGSSASGELVAIVAFSICFAAYTSVIFRTTVKGIDAGQTEAALSLGYTQTKAFIHFILPQVVQRALPIYKGEFIGLVKATSIVGYIAVFDLTKAGDMIRSRTFEAFFPLIVVTILYFLVIWVLSLLLKYAELKTQPKRRKFFK